MSKEQIAEIQEGYAAHMLGVPLESNPYDVNESDEFTRRYSSRWRLGWFAHERRIPLEKAHILGESNGI